LSSKHRADTSSHLDINSLKIQNDKEEALTILSGSKIAAPVIST
jgi:hypothetical protein